MAGSRSTIEMDIDRRLLAAGELCSGPPEDVANAYLSALSKLYGHEVEVHSVVKYLGPDRYLIVVAELLYPDGYLGCRYASLDGHTRIYSKSDVINMLLTLWDRIDWNETYVKCVCDSKHAEQKETSRCH